MQKMTKASARILTVAAMAVAMAGCAMDDVEIPQSLVGPAALGISFHMSALPDVLYADGASQSVVTVVVRDENGQPLAGQLLYFELWSGDGAIIAGGVLVGRLQGGLAVASDARGVAQVIYQAGYNRERVSIAARPYSFDANSQFLRYVEIDQL